MAEIMKKLLLNDALEIMYDAEYNFAITVDGVTLYTAPDVYAELCRYATFTYISTDATVGGFSDRWAAWIRQQGGDLKRAYDALNAQYNPIENYDMTETQADGVKRDADTDTTTPTGTTTTTTTADRWGYDSENGVPVDSATAVQSYQGYHVDTEKTHGNTLQGEDLSGSYNEVREHTLSRSGNIGVTTAQQMIASELELRQQDLLAQFVSRFVEKWCSLI